MAKIASYTWATCGDQDTCAHCKEKEGKEWKRKKDIEVKPPLPGCTSHQGCRCQIVGIYDDEGVVELG